ncbi:MAG: FkbM family methyltransferase [Bacteroidia bacterium]|nr:FkbM family methyltransferase [Bacteroidia bacterium]MDW8016014.1 FkbM family methyltransferase [Bacteroidia bacterium]
MLGKLGIPYGKGWLPTLKLYMNVLWNRLIAKPLKLRTNWKNFPWDIRQEIFWWKYLQAWADVDARTWAVNPEPPFPFKDLISPSSIGLDIGAHRGFWSLAHARHVSYPGKVFLLEPDPLNYFHLVRNLQANDLSAHYPLPFGAWREPQWLTLVPDEEGLSFMHKIENTPGQTFCISVDELVRCLRLSQLDWIKIDAEGAELAILEGATQVLRSLRPTVWMEVSSDHSSLIDFILRMDYTLKARHTFSGNLEYWWIEPRKIPEES